MTGKKNDTGTFVLKFYSLSPELSVMNFEHFLHISHMFIFIIRTSKKGNNYYCFLYKLYIIKK